MVKYFNIHGYELRFTFTAGIRQACDKLCSVKTIVVF